MMILYNIIRGYKVAKKQRKKNIHTGFKTHYSIILGVIAFLILSLVMLIVFYHEVDKTEPITNQIVENKQAKLKEEYNNCLKSSVDLSKYESVVTYEKELNNFFKKYNVSVLFETLDESYSYSYNKDVIYYAASTIKVLDSLYIYNKAIAGELDLDTSITYTSKYSYSDSEGMDKHKYGDKVSLRELVSYAIMYSDNAAHFMLVDYIGQAKLKKYSNDLGAKFYLTASDYFGSININNALIYLKELHRLISLDTEYSKELNNYFIKSNSNYLKVDVLGIDAATKYGYYNNYFHNYGIVYAEDPYYLIVLTKEGEHDFEKVIETINNRIYKLYVIRNMAKRNVCEEKVYGVQD